MDLVTQIKCKKCGKIFMISAKDISTEEVKMVEDGKELTLTKIVCPECNDVQIVQVDDENTFELLNKLTYELGKVRNYTGSSRLKSIPKELKNDVEELRKTLKMARLLLIVDYRKRPYMSEDGTVNELVLTYTYEGDKNVKKKNRKRKGSFKS